MMHDACAAVHNKRLTLIVWMRDTVCHRRAFEIPMYWGQRARKAKNRARKGGCGAGVWSGGKTYDRKDFERGLYNHTLL
jgi:hypothetical protein